MFLPLETFWIIWISASFFWKCKQKNSKWKKNLDWSRFISVSFKPRYKNKEDLGSTGKTTYENSFLNLLSCSLKTVNILNFFVVAKNKLWTFWMPLYFFCNLMKCPKKWEMRPAKTFNDNRRRPLVRILQ